MKKILRTLIFSVAYLILFSPILGFIAWIANEHFDKAAGVKFERVTLNDSEQSVVSVMGKPDNESPCGDNLWWGETYIGKNAGQCVKQVRYEYFLSAWSFGYSKDGKVVSKYHYFSE